VVPADVLGVSAATFVGGVLSSLVGNVLFSLGQYGLVSRPEHAGWSAEDETILTRAVRAQLSRYLKGDSRNPDDRGSAKELQKLCQSQTMRKRISEYLRSATAESLVRQAFVGEADDDLLLLLRKRFTDHFQLYTEADSKQTSTAAEELFDSLVVGIRAALRDARPPLISPHEALSELRYEVLHREIAALKEPQVAEERGGLRNVDSERIAAFESRLRKRMRAAFSQIRINSYERSEYRDIESVYVAPEFRRRDRAAPLSDPISPAALLAQTCRTVVLGDPGGGKSTFAQWLCFTLCADEPPRIVGGRQVTPLLVLAREFARERMQRHSSVLDHIINILETKYQIDSVPRTLVRHLLANGHLLVIFDGLDEVIIPGYRQEVMDCIDAFADEYPAAPILATSRVVGYDRAPLRRHFTVFKVAPFDESEIEEYATKWFRTLTDYSADEQTRTAESFVEDSKIARDLCSNPLMLALICSLYRKKGDIPRNRPELYRKCSDLLIRKWDRERGILVEEPFDKLIQLLSHLAHWLFSTPALAGDATEPRLIEKTKEILWPRWISNSDDAERVARAVIEFCRDRAWVLSAIGSDEDSTQRYGFTHRTFLEYYTAVYIARECLSGKDLYELLANRLEDASWVVVAQIALQRLDESHDRAADGFLAALCESPTTGEAHVSELRFGCECLHYVVPSSEATRHLARRVFEFLRSRTANSEDQPVADIIAALAAATPTNRGNIGSELTALASSFEASDDSHSALLLLDMTACLALFAARRSRQGDDALGTASRSAFWDSVTRECLVRAGGTLGRAASRGAEIASLLYTHGVIALDQLLRLYSPDVVFQSHSNAVLPRALPPVSIAALILTPCCGLAEQASALWGVPMDGILNAAAAWGKYFTKSRPPFFSGARLTQECEVLQDALLEVFKTRGATRSAASDKDQNLAAWVIAAAVVETLGSLTLAHAFTSLRSPAASAIGWSILSRSNPHREAEAVSDFGAAAVPEEGSSLLREWAQGNVHLAGASRPQGTP
jgi:hypothetical protein